MCSSDLFPSHDKPGGGAGAQVQGVNNTGTQAVMMGLQAKSIESQIALNNAQASKI